MQSIVQYLTEFGTASLEAFWVPVGIWTALGLFCLGILRIFESRISALYKYHSRVALLWGLAAGVLGTLLFYLMPVNSSAGGVISTKFIVIQNPITVTTSAAESAISWGDPALWIGFFTALIMLIGMGALLKLAADFIQLSRFASNLGTGNAQLRKTLNKSNNQLIQRCNKPVAITFSNDICVPCTFGVFQKRIVLPQFLSDDAEKLNMAVRHELIHIQNNDFLINASVQTIRSLFLFHPLVHKIAAAIEPYREMSCDQHVLQDADISQQNYARLLFELSPQPVFKTASAVNMAVNPSTLKKRIHTMKTRTPHLPSLRTSFALMLFSAFMITGLMACSDIEEGGITRSEVEETQSQINNIPTENQPLILVDGEELKKENMGQIDPNSIQSVHVLKDQEATEQFGEAGKNGVIDITLKTDAEMKTQSEKQSNAQIPEEEVFMAVENQPKLKSSMAQLQRKVNYPVECKDKGFEGRVTVQFVVDEQGQVQNAEVIRGIGDSCDEEALRVIKTAEFTPGLQRGERVKVRMALPIVFRIDKGGNDSTDDSKMNSHLPEHSESNITLDQLTITTYKSQNNSTLPSIVYVSDTFKNMSKN